MGLPMSPVAIVEVSELLISETPALERFRSTPGKQFGCVFQAKGHEDTWPSVLSKASNLADLAGIMVFDTWMHNQDRADNMTNLQVVRDAASSYRVIIYDHGWAFGGTPVWSAESLREQRERILVPNIDGSVYGQFKPYVKPTDFEPWLSKLEALDPAIIAQLIEEIPEEWEVSREEKQALLDYLTSRQRLARPVMMSLKDRYPNPGK